jgi:hypothetical protein
MADNPTSNPRQTKRGATDQAAPTASLSRGTRQTESGRPGGGQGRVDDTGIIPEGIRIDPNLTDGHPGPEQSGDSEIIPTERFSQPRERDKKEDR